MENKIIKWSFKSLLCAGVLGLVACSDIINEEGGITEETPDTSKPVYFAISIRDVSTQESATRADRFDSDNNDVIGTQGYIFNKGLSNEKAIYGKDAFLGTDDDGYSQFLDTPHRALIFDNNGRKIGDLFLKSVFTQDSPDETPDDRDTYTILYTSVPEETMLTIKADASKVLVVLNASEEVRAKIDPLVTYSSIMNIIEDSDNVLYFEDGSDKYFTMSSSIVLGEDAAKTPGPYNVGSFPEYYYSKDEAIANASKMEMYVERLQSKYTVLFRTKSGVSIYYFDPSEASSVAGAEYQPVNTLILSSDQDFEPENKELRYVSQYTRGESVNNTGTLTVNNGTWKVNFTGWSLNALEKEEYLFKRIYSGSPYFTDWHTLDYRSFWAEDNSYKSGKYPDQYREAEDDESVSPYDQTGASDPTDYSLIYYSYKDLNKKELHQYSPESTFDVSLFPQKYSDYKAAYADLAHMRRGTHLIITAQLLINGFDTETAYSFTTTDATTGLISGVADKYYMNGIYWSEDAYKEYVAEYLAFWMLSGTNQDASKFGPNDGIFYTDENGTVAKASDFEIVKANIKGGDGMVWIKPKTNVTLYVKNPEEETDSYTDITSKYEALAKEHKEYYARHYNEGRMYYPVPVRHNINYSNVNNLSGTGDYGSVRNHWYYFTVEKIMTPGASVDDPEQPIVPNPDPTINGLGVNIKVLDWNSIDTEIENILDQNHSSDRKE